MSIENIIDYVIKTPKNTNPNVIRSLVKSEVDENTLQKAKEYTDSQRLAYSEVNNGRLYFYGDTTGKFEFPMDEIMGDPALSTMGLVKISDVTPPAGSITEVWMSTKSGTHFAQYRSFEVVNIEDGISLVFAVYEDVVQDIPLLMIVSGLHPEMNGLYVRVQYHSSIEHTAENVELFVGSIDGEVIETVYPIDPKYLPAGVGGGSGWVELTDYGTIPEDADPLTQKVYFECSPELAEKLNNAVCSDDFAGFKWTIDGGAEGKIIQKFPAIFVQAASAYYRTDVGCLGIGAEGIDPAMWTFTVVYHPIANLYGVEFYLTAVAHEE